MYYLYCVFTYLLYMLTTPEIRSDDDDDGGGDDDDDDDDDDA